MAWQRASIQKLALLALLDLLAVCALMCSVLVDSVMLIAGAVDSAKVLLRYRRVCHMAEEDGIVECSRGTMQATRILGSQGKD